MKKALVFIATALIGVAAMAQPKFAHVSLSELIQLMPEADDARAKLEASSLEAQETFQAMVEEYQAKYTTYSQKASTWTTAIRESKDKDGNVKYASATGAKGYLWLEAEAVYAFKEKRDAIDYSYYNKLVDEAVETISQFGDFELFVSDDPIPYNYMRIKDLDSPPWK